jgi:hypothetical protein
VVLLAAVVVSEPGAAVAVSIGALLSIGFVVAVAYGEAVVWSV